MKTKKTITSSDSIIKNFTSELAKVEYVSESIKEGKLIVVVGAGVSVGLTDRKSPLWNDLISSGLSHCLLKGLISDSQNEKWQSILSSDDLDELLSAAEFMSRKLLTSNKDLFIRWLKNIFQKLKPTNTAMIEAIQAIHSAGVPICTLNYDTLLEDITGLPTILMSDTENVSQWMRNECTGILHLHGSWKMPLSCILSVSDYQTTIKDEVRDLIQRSLGSFKHLLFIGCGGTLSDPNFSNLSSWLRKNMSAATLQHYALVKSSEVVERHTDPSWQGFVEPISFGDDFSDLPVFLCANFSVKKNDPSLLAVKDSVSHLVLENYRRFLLKDCGQMTIEGIKADMDTTKQKFDIEKLFVPLYVSPFPPEYPASDANRDKKISKWLENNANPIPFGDALTDNKRLALLALPGGGKTMLLKRLAVAYADPRRREITTDSLPEKDFFPVIIRCREWRNYIRNPIITLLKYLPEITGQANLDGLADALIPMLNSGKVLLLIDGLDEIHNDADREIFVEHLEKFIDEYKSTHLIITSREAGFNLVAPCLVRFCTRFRISPLSRDAIEKLCYHWHILMTGDSPESLEEAKSLAEHIANTTALNKLAENPLLLTMLLVVKHGAGRLPPDRVALYERAVEVLLDTWNIKGHDALNLKEAIPQLSCIAFELMRQGKQTATENELLKLLEYARKALPHIDRYAKDSPDEFLKRVELRSSLLLEAGHQRESGKVVPFYQFRHLTFQEYLAAVAAANGHFIGYQTKNSVLDPLKPFLLTEEWKEIVPMAAVLAGKQVEPLISALVAEARKLKLKLIAEQDFFGKKQWIEYPIKLPSPISRIVQCLIEEVQIPQEILPEALQLIAYFSRACRSSDDWQSLVRGPYGTELLHQAWKLYESNKAPTDSQVRNSCANLGALKFPLPYWGSKAGKDHLRKMITSSETEQVSMGLLTSTGLIFQERRSKRKFSLPIKLSQVEEKIYDESRTIWTAAVWLWALNRAYSKNVAVPSTQLLDRLLILWTLEQEQGQGVDNRITSFAISTISSLPRDFWKPKPTAKQKIYILKCLDREIQTSPYQTLDLQYERFSACVVAFYSQSILSDEDLAKIIASFEMGSVISDRFPPQKMLVQMGEIGGKYLSQFNKVKKIKRST